MTTHVAIAADGDFIQHAMVTMRSVLANAGGHDVVVHFLHGDDMSAEWAARLSGDARERGGELVLHHVEAADLRDVPLRKDGSLANWYRYLLPDLLGDIDTVLYLDSDTVAADDLGPLFTTSLDDCYVAAVDDLMGALLAHTSRRLQVPADRRYFNAGVLLLNLAAIREDGLVPQMLAHGRFMAGHGLLPNQDAINAVLGGRRKTLAPRWNLMSEFLGLAQYSAEFFGEAAFEEARRNPGIRHFEGGTKPWRVKWALSGKELYFAYA